MDENTPRVRLHTGDEPKWKLFLGFLWALPRLPGALWTQRHEIVNGLFQSHVWLTKADRKAFEEHQKDVERWRSNLSG